MSELGLLFGSIDCSATVVLRIYNDVNEYKDVIATFENIEDYANLSIMCIIPEDRGKLIIELA